MSPSNQYPTSCILQKNVKGRKIEKMKVKKSRKMDKKGDSGGEAPRKGGFGLKGAPTGEADIVIRAKVEGWILPTQKT